MTRLEQEKRKKWLLDYILYKKSEDSEIRQMAIQNKGFLNSSVSFIPFSSSTRYSIGQVAKL